MGRLVVASKAIRGPPIASNHHLAPPARSARWDARYRGMFEHYAKRKTRTRAIVPVAHQILTDVYEVWESGITCLELIQKKRKQPG